MSKKPWIWSACRSHVITRSTPAARSRLVIIWRYFYIAIAIWVLSVVVGLFKRDLVYKYVYTIDGKTLTVKKAYNEERVVVLESINLATDEYTVTTEESDKKYYETPSGTVVSIQKADGSGFSIDVDDYFYAVLDHSKRR